MEVPSTGKRLVYVFEGQTQLCRSDAMLSQKATTACTLTQVKRSSKPRFTGVRACTQKLAHGHSMRFFLFRRCLGKFQAVRSSVSKAKETTGMYNGPLNKIPKLIKQQRHKETN